MWLAGFVTLRHITLLCYVIFHRHVTSYYFLCYVMSYYTVMLRHISPSRYVILLFVLRYVILHCVILHDISSLHCVIYKLSFVRYKEAFTRLRSLKTEIEHLQHLLEKSKVQMQKDFEKWWTEQSTLPHRSQNGKVKSVSSNFVQNKIVMIQSYVYILIFSSHRLISVVILLNLKAHLHRRFLLRSFSF